VWVGGWDAPQPKFMGVWCGGGNFPNGNVPNLGVIHLVCFKNKKKTPWFFYDENNKVIFFNFFSTIVDFLKFPAYFHHRKTPKICYGVFFLSR